MGAAEAWKPPSKWALSPPQNRVENRPSRKSRISPGRGNFPRGGRAEISPSRDTPPGPRISRFSQKLGKTPENGHFAVGFEYGPGNGRFCPPGWKNGVRAEKTSRRGAETRISGNPEKSRPGMEVFHLSEPRFQNAPNQSSTKSQFCEKIIWSRIGRSVILWSKNRKNLTNSVPTGRVIKYPTKCALFLSRAGGRPREGPGRGPKPPILHENPGKSWKSPENRPFPGSLFLLLSI